MYDYISYPNSFGHTEQAAVSAYAQILQATILNRDKKCHRYVHKILCHLFYPKCPDNDARFVDTEFGSRNKQMTMPAGDEETSKPHITPNLPVVRSPNHVKETTYLVPICRELCFDVCEACKEQFETILNVITSCCTYYPKAEDSEICVNYDVTCENAPRVENSHMFYQGNLNSSTAKYDVGTMVQYECFDGYDMEGPSNATCEFSGEWSSVPVCIPAPKLKPDASLGLRERIFFFGGIPLICVILIMILCCVLAKCLLTQKSVDLKKLDTDENLDVPPTKFNFVLDLRAKPDETFVKRNKEFDSFVIFFSAIPTTEDAFPISNDEKFVKESIQPKFDREKGGKYKLCCHRRNFMAGVPILTNIHWAIENSNSAIVILSQDFIDAYWCTKEFELCMWEHDKLDPSFRLFVILMQPKETLRNCTVYMENFFRNINYLEHDDPNLWVKLDQQLQLVQSCSGDETI